MRWDAETGWGWGSGQGERQAGDRAGVLGGTLWVFPELGRLLEASQPRQSREMETYSWPMMWFRGWWG